MEKQIVFVASFLFIAELRRVDGAATTASPTKLHTSLKLFVFGDSYADTGNWGKTDAPSWKKPYGMSFPGKPSGRFSDGRVLTDYIASFLKIESPVPYQWRRHSNATVLKHGMNFAYGGTGVFPTYVGAPNMTTQINQFQQIVDDEVYTRKDLKSSIALVSLGGNDYGTYLTENGNTRDIYAFAASIIKQLELNLRRIHGLGVGKIWITAIEPLGCLPSFTASASYRNCSETGNLLAMLHNKLLNQTILKLNESSSSSFIILDLYDAFLSVFKKQGFEPAGNSNSESILKPCCMGVASEYNCGSVEASNGTSMYTVCKNANSTFFWDTVHPTQSGWQAAYESLKPTLHKLKH